MKIRTVTELSQRVREDLAYRRKEIQYYSGLVDNAGVASKQATLRGAIAVLYAHWEGFVKFSLQTYVDFVRLQRHIVRDLSSPFVAMAAKKRLDALVTANRPALHIETVRWFRESDEEPAKVPDGSVIDARGNLSVEVLQDLITMVGLEYRNEYAVAEKPVIQRLLELRNKLAHGEWPLIDEIEWKAQLQPKIGELLETICTQVEAAASNGTFKRSS